MSQSINMNLWGKGGGSAGYCPVFQWGSDVEYLLFNGRDRPKKLRIDLPSL